MGPIIITAIDVYAAYRRAMRLKRVAGVLKGLFDSAQDVKSNSLPEVHEDYMLFFESYVSTDYVATSLNAPMLPADKWAAIHADILRHPVFANVGGSVADKVVAYYHLMPYAVTKLNGDILRFFLDLARRIEATYEYFTTATVVFNLDILKNTVHNNIETVKQLNLAYRKKMSIDIELDYLNQLMKSVVNDSGFAKKVALDKNSQTSLFGRTMGFVLSSLLESAKKRSNKLGTLLSLHNPIISSAGYTGVPLFAFHQNITTLPLTSEFVRMMDRHLTQSIPYVLHNGQLLHSSTVIKEQSESEVNDATGKTIIQDKSKHKS